MNDVSKHMAEYSNAFLTDSHVSVLAYVLKSPHVFSELFHIFNCLLSFFEELHLLLDREVNYLILLV